MPKFCPECESYMHKSTATGTIIYKCRCQFTMQGNEYDTLMDEQIYGAAESNIKYIDFINNSAHDPAGNRINKPCPSCKVPFITTIRLGSTEMVMFLCDCGWRGTSIDDNG